MSERSKKLRERFVDQLQGELLHEFNVMIYILKNIREEKNSGKLSDEDCKFIGSRVASFTESKIFSELMDEMTTLFNEVNIVI